MRWLLLFVYCQQYTVFYDYYIFDDVFYSCLNAKVKQIAFTNTETIIFGSEFIQELFKKIMKLPLCFKY